MDSPADLSLAGAASLVAAREISSRELTQAMLDRIERVDPAIGAFAQIEPELALAQADACDRDLSEGRARGPLHGVPLAHKDLLYRTGAPAQAGSPLRAGWRARSDATVLSQLEAAGAVTLGRLAMAEFAYDPTGNNGVSGLARNPWNADRICGGSSSGSGAAVAARLCFGSIGSDTGGSIRLPAAICGVVGLKPTHGRVSLHGAMPLSFSMDCLGPLTRNVADAALMLAAIAGPDPLDATSFDIPAGDYSAACRQTPHGLVVGIPHDYFWQHVDQNIADLLHRAIDRMTQAGCKVVQVSLSDMDAAVAAASIVLGAEAAALHRPDFAAAPDGYSPAVRTRMENGLGYLAVDYIDALRYRAVALARYLEATAEVHVVAAPALGTPVPTVSEIETTALGGTSHVAAMLTYWTRPANFLGIPAISVPAGLGADGMPVGLQLMGKPFAEATLLRAGSAAEAVSEMAGARPALS